MTNLPPTTEATPSDQGMVPGPETRMGALLENFPGARRALFRNFHIGGCSQCGFRDDETLSEVCLRNQQSDLEPVIAAILNAHEEDRKLFIAPATLAQWRQDNVPHRLVDTRSREEYDAVKINGAEFLDRDLSAALASGMATDGENTIVLYDHQGRHVLDTASYFIGHGARGILCLQGGIDAWAREVEPSMPRYELE